MVQDAFVHGFESCRLIEIAHHRTGRPIHAEVEKKPQPNTSDQRGNGASHPEPASSGQRHAEPLSLTAAATRIAKLKKARNEAAMTQNRIAVCRAKSPE